MLRRPANPAEDKAVWSTAGCF